VALLSRVKLQPNTLLCSSELLPVKTMAEETKGEELPPVKTPAVNHKPQDDRNGKSRRDAKRDDTPIEELFDLSKPIPRVERPDKADHEKELDELSNQIKVVQEQRQKVQETIDNKYNSAKGSEISIERESLSKLRSQKGALIDEKKQIFSKLDAIKSQRDKLEKDRKDTRANVKFQNIADIDKEIAKLKKKQETTSMSLNDEKGLIREMEALQSSKKLVADLKLKQTDFEDNKVKRKSLGAQISAKDKEIDQVQESIDEKLNKINVLSKKENKKRDDIKGLFTKRDDLRKRMNEFFSKKDAARATYRDNNNAWYNQKRAVAAQKKLQYEAEKKEHEDELDAWRKAKEEEEAKKVPYEEEQALCNYLAEYLTRTYLVDKDAEAKRVADESEAKRAASVVPVVDDPFAGFKPKIKEGETQYFGKGKKKKKRDRTKKKEEKAVAGPFTLNLDTFEQFALIGLSPPVSAEQVAKSVEDLKARKVWYSEQPRGSVQTATEVRRATEKAASKQKNSKKENSTSSDKSKGKSKGNKFSLSEDDFAPLGSATGSSSLNKTWGQKSTQNELAAAEVGDGSKNQTEVED